MAVISPATGQIMAKEFFMKKILSSMGLICLMLFAFTAIGCESTDWAMVADSLYTVSNSLSSAYSGSGGTSSSGTQYSLTIVNNTGFDAYYVYVSPSSSDSWGSDVLGSRILGNGQTITVPLSRGGLWDIQLMDGDDDTYSKYNVTANSRVVFVFDDIDW